MISIIILVSWSGHHPSYATQLIRACNAFSRQIYALCPAEADLIGRLGNSTALIQKTTVVVHANRASRSGFRDFSDLMADLHDLRCSVESIRQANPADQLLVFHTSLDSLFIGILHLPRLAFRIREVFPWPFSGLLLSPDRRWPLHRARAILGRLFGNANSGGKPVGFFRPLVEFGLGGVGSLLRQAYLWQRNLILKRSSCAQILVEDERYIDWLRLSTGKRVMHFPEITSVGVSTPPPNLVQKISQCKQGRVVVGLLGELSRRKCLDLLLDVIHKHDTDGFLFVIAGPCDPDAFPAPYRSFLLEGIYQRSNVLFSPQRIASEGDFNAIIASCDIIYCVYRDHLHSSNIVSKAAAFHKPLVVSDGELMAKRVRDYDIGCVLEKQTAEACLAVLRKMSTSEYRASFLRTGKFAKYMEDHSFESLQRVMTSLSTRII